MQAGKERTECGIGKDPGSIPDPDHAHRYTRGQNTVISDPDQTNPELSSPFIGMTGDLTESADQGVVADLDQLRAELIDPAGLHNLGILTDRNSRHPVEAVLESPGPKYHREEDQTAQEKPLAEWTVQGRPVDTVLLGELSQSGKGIEVCPPLQKDTKAGGTVWNIRIQLPDINRIRRSRTSNSDNPSFFLP